MGTVFVVVAGQHGNNAENFYKMFPAESVLPNREILQISKVVRVSSPSLDTLLRAIHRRGDQEIVVVSHGVPSQLAIPVMRGVRIGLNIDFINAILGTDSNASLARRLHTSARNVATLRTRIRQVQQLRLSRLEFRACRVGRSQQTLEALQRLFGASTASAPRAFDGYGRIQGTSPTTASAVLTQWQSSHIGYQTFGTSPNRFFWVNNGSVDPPGISAVFAESWGGVRAWAEAKFPSGASHNFRRGTFYYHIQTNTAQNSSSAHGSRTFDNNFVFPNDQGYRQNLIRVQSSTPAQPAPTTGSAPQGRSTIGLDSHYAAFDASHNEVLLSERQYQSRTPGPEGLVA